MIIPRIVSDMMKSEFSNPKKTEDFFRSQAPFLVPKPLLGNALAGEAPHTHQAKDFYDSGTPEDQGFAFRLPLIRK
jgi:hypothetical protein